MNSKPRIVLIADSLSLPRAYNKFSVVKKKNIDPEGDYIEYEETYPYLLRKSLSGFEIIFRNSRANTTKDVYAEVINNEIYVFKPDILILHIGIVDCFPRLFTLKEKRLLQFLSNKMRTKIIQYFSKRRYKITKRRKINIIPLDKFTKYVEEICKGD